MSDRRLILGIDTSNYTTSLALVTEEGRLVANLKLPLPVKEGERGLRQSDAVFAHTKNLPSLMETAREYVRGSEIIAVGVSEKPRNAEGSYMPCFLSGVAAAQSVGLASGAPVYRFSHQCGHVMSALYSSGGMSLCSREFGAFHLSGGTSDLLKVSYNGFGFESQRVGGTRDLNAGQIVDRIGVYMGLSFPAGAALEALASEYSGKIPKKRVSVSGMDMNLSGLENMAVELYKKTLDKNAVAAFVFDYLGESVAAVAEAYLERFGKMPLVFAGGVMSNNILKSRLSSLGECYFAEPALSADNAVGIAVLASMAHLKG